MATHFVYVKYMTSCSWSHPDVDIPDFVRGIKKSIIIRFASESEQQQATAKSVRWTIQKAFARYGVALELETIDPFQQILAGDAPKEDFIVMYEPHPEPEPQPEALTEISSRAMTVGQLRAQLASLPSDMPVVMQLDSEGNGYKYVTGADPDNVSVDGKRDVYNANWTAVEADMDEDEWAALREGQKILVILPFN
jgi:hypothetical protein